MNKKANKPKVYVTEALRQAAKVVTELTAGAMSSIHKGIDIGQRSSLTASERKRLAPTMLDKMEARLLKMLSGWSIQDIECLLVHRVLPEVKRRVKLPK
jgi:hypothetical protein